MQKQGYDTGKIKLIETIYINYVYILPHSELFLLTVGVEHGFITCFVR
jgi:hypothetical protein